MLYVASEVMFQTYTRSSEHDPRLGCTVELDIGPQDIVEFTLPLSFPVF